MFMEILTNTAAATSGDICLPYPAAAAGGGAFAGTLAYLQKRGDKKEELAAGYQADEIRRQGDENRKKEDRIARLEEQIQQGGRG